MHILMPLFLCCIFPGISVTGEGTLKIPDHPEGKTCTLHISYLLFTRRLHSTFENLILENLNSVLYTIITLKVFNASLLNPSIYFHEECALSILLTAFTRQTKPKPILGWLNGVVHNSSYRYRPRDFSSLVIITFKGGEWMVFSAKFSPMKVFFHSLDLYDNDEPLNLPNTGIFVTGERQDTVFRNCFECPNLIYKGEYSTTRKYRLRNLLVSANQFIPDFPKCLKPERIVPIKDGLTCELEYFVFHNLQNIYNFSFKPYSKFSFNPYGPVLDAQVYFNRTVFLDSNVVHILKVGLSVTIYCTSKPVHKNKLSFENLVSNLPKCVWLAFCISITFYGLFGEGVLIKIIKRSSVSITLLFRYCFCLLQMLLDQSPSVSNGGKFVLYIGVMLFSWLYRQDITVGMIVSHPLQVINDMNELVNSGYSIMVNHNLTTEDEIQKGPRRKCKEIVEDIYRKQPLMISFNRSHQICYPSPINENIHENFFTFVNGSQKVALYSSSFDLLYRRMALGYLHKHYENVTCFNIKVPHRELYMDIEAANPLGIQMKDTVHLFFKHGLIRIWTVLSTMPGTYLIDRNYSANAPQLTTRVDVLSSLNIDSIFNVLVLWTLLSLLVCFVFVSETAIALIPIAWTTVNFYTNCMTNILKYLYILTTDIIKSIQS